MKRIRMVSLLCSVLAMIGQAAPLTAQTKKDSKAPSLYQRLGGSEALGAIFDDVGPRMAADPLLARFFQGQSPEALTAQRNRTVEFLCHETGGPCEYTGQPLKRAHGVLHINEAQWNAFLKHLGETLDHLKIADNEKHEMLALVRHFKSEVVEKK
jgi:hemoglobin